MRKLCDGFIEMLQAYSAVLTLVMLAVVLLGVFYRYLMFQALSWYDEFAGYILVWMTMYGSVVALARGKHISFETLVEKLSQRWQRVAAVFAALCVLSFSLVVLVSGWELIREMADETAVSLPAIRMAWVYSVMPISGGLMVLVGVVHLVKLMTKRESMDNIRPKAMEEGQ
jgi:TRAP-type C4-dicarboxylate transport system permease small subunit